MLAAFALAATPYFKIRVVDETTGRGIPLVELRTVNNLRFVTDSAGLVAFDEPGLMDGQEVYFHLRSPGYEKDADSFGYRGVALRPKAGATATVRLKRTDVAERICRLTGQGIYRDSLLLGEKTPLKNPVLNGGVLGQDTAQAEVYKGRMLWFWGDTDRAGFPLGNFHTSGAVATLPEGGAHRGLDFAYFQKGGFVRPMVESKDTHPIWVSGLVVLKDSSGAPLGDIHHRGRRDLRGLVTGMPTGADLASGTLPGSVLGPGLPGGLDPRLLSVTPPGSGRPSPESPENPSRHAFFAPYRLSEGPPGRSRKDAKSRSGRAERGGETGSEPTTKSFPEGREELYAYYAQIRKLGEIATSGYLKWNDAAERFDIAQTFAKDRGWRFLDGHTVQHEGYALGNDPPNVRVRADAKSLMDAGAYEAFTCLEADGSVRRVDGKADYRWQRDLPPISSAIEARLVREGKLRSDETHFLPLDEEGKPVTIANGSVHWNAYRKRWVGIFGRKGGKDSVLGEIDYAEADAPTGPFRRAVKVCDHPRYTFYNPVHHAFLDKGSAIYFEGTYTAEFSGNEDKTPLYNYNQLLYRLDLSDGRLAYAKR